jgi:hypothetical protein
MGPTPVLALALVALAEPGAARHERATSRRWTAGQQGPQQAVVIAFTETGTMSPTAFLEELRIQLGGRARIDEAPSLSKGLAREAPDAVLEVMRAQSAALAVSIESSTVAHGLRIYGYAREIGSVVELGRLAGEHSVDEDRTLALKVGELLDTVLSKRDSVSALVAEPKVEEPRAISLMLEIGAFIGSGSGASGASSAAGGFLAAPGVRFGAGERRLEVFALLRAPLDSVTSSSLGRVTTSETAFGIGARLLLSTDARVAFGPALDVDLRHLHAIGTAPDGRTGTADRVLPVASAGVAAGFAPAPWFELRAQGGVEVSFVEERFAVAGSTIQHYGRLRPTGQATVVLIIP